MTNSKTKRSRRLGPWLRPIWIAFVSVSTMFVGATWVEAQDATSISITGRVTDQTGVAIVDAAVSLTGPGAGGETRVTLTDAAGRYRFGTLTPGSYELRTRRLGFADTSRSVTVTSGPSVIDLTLATETIRVEGVVAESRRDSDRERDRFESEPGVTARVVEGQTLKLLPGLGESDILRAIELLPGVISTSDFSSSFNVRGGSADQNLILLDGFTVFNPFHLGGLFSVFNSDAVERAELFAGGFGAEFGGRVSSVLNIESRTDIPEGLEATGGVSLLATRLMLRAPMPTPIISRLGATRGGWFISGRRSYFDQILRPVADFPYHLTDLQGYATLESASGGRFALTTYWGEDVLDLSNRGLADGGGAADVLRIRWNWGNRVLGGTWLQPLRSGWVVDSRLGYSRFADQLNFVDFGDVNFQSRIEQFVVRADLGGDFAPNVSARFGIAGDAIDHDNLAEAGGTTFFESEGQGLLGSAHASLRWSPGSWIIEPGIRLDSWTSADTTRNLLSPRFAAKRFLGRGETVAVKVAVGRYGQFVHSLRDEELPVSNDTWVLANRWVPHVVSDQLQVGVEAFWGAGWSGSVEAYARSFDGITEFNTSEDPNTLADDLLEGTGEARGLDMLLRRSEGDLTGWLSLSLLRAERTFPEPLAEGFEDLPQTVTFPPIFDRRVNLDAVLQYVGPREVEVGLRWNYGSGLPHSRPIAQYFAWSHNPGAGSLEPFELGPDNDGLPVAVVLGPRNGERYPAYHRLDLTVRRSVERSWGTYVPYLQVLNVYNRRNVLFYFYDYDQSPPVRSGFSMFPLLPAIGVEIAF